MPTLRGQTTLMNVRFRLLLIILLALNTATVSAESPKLGHRLSAIKITLPAPDFTLLDMDEEEHSLSDYRGKVVMLNFWATWCPPCRREMPSMERLHNQLDKDKFKVLAINQMESADHVFAYTGQLDVDPTFTILFDLNSEVSRKLNVKGLPTTYLIDKQGNIRYRAIGGREFDHPEVIRLIKQLIDE